MASKEATIYIVDLGSTTGECHSGRVQTDLDYGMTYVWEKIALTMGMSLKSLSVGVIGFRTDETDNPLEADEEYSNISVLKPLGPMEMEHLLDLKRKIVTNDTNVGDAISAVVLGVHMITEFTTLKSGKPGKYARKIVLLTDGQGNIEDSQIDSIAAQINECDINLVVIGIDFDDPEFGFKEEDKSTNKQRNEALLRRLTESCTNGVYGTVAAAIESLAVPNLKQHRVYTTFDGRLCLGDPEKYKNTAMYIDVKRHFKTHLARPTPASSFVAKMPAASTQSSNTLNGDVEMTDAPAGGDGLTSVKSTITYIVNDPTAPGGKRHVGREDLEKGYLYGRSAVHINDSDKNVTEIETFKSFSIIGFIPNDKYERFLNMGETCVTIAQPTNDKARMAFSSLVHALFELDSYAVARIVKKDGLAPQLILLAPSIDPELEALIDVPLPFAEDVRVYRFPPLDRVITASGSTLKKHRYLPDEELVDAMSDYVDTMDLSTAGQDEEGQPAEYLNLDKDYSAYAPIIHRLSQAILQRAVYPEDLTIGPPSELLTRFSQPPSDVVSKSAPKLQKLMKVAHVQKVPPKAKGTRYRRDVIKPLSGLDVNALLSREKRQKLSVQNTIPEFKQMLESPPDDNAIYDATKQMTEVIFKLISSSTSEARYPEAVADMRVFKEYMIDYEMPEIWNKFVQDLKTRVIRGELGGDRRGFWVSLRGYKLGLIDKSDLEISDVTEKEANEFFSLKEESTRNGAK